MFAAGVAADDVTVAPLLVRPIEGKVVNHCVGHMPAIAERAVVNRRVYKVAVIQV